jgi:hypothetical protein
MLVRVLRTYELPEILVLAAATLRAGAFALTPSARAIFFSSPMEFHQQFKKYRNSIWDSCAESKDQKNCTADYVTVR